MPTIFVITDKSRKIVAAMREVLGGKATLFPLAGQKMHRIEDVPVEVADLVNPVEFHKAITNHFNTEGSKVTPFDPLKGRTKPHAQ